MHITLETDGLSELFPAFICLNRCGTIIEVGPSFLRLYGSEILGQDFFTTMPFEHLSTINRIEGGLYDYPKVWRNRPGIDYFKVIV